MSASVTTASGHSNKSTKTQIVIVGAGLAGSVAAVTLGRAGYRVTLVDRYAEYPPEFRVEKIAGAQVAALKRLGLLDAVAAASTRFDHIVNYRRGRVLDHSWSPHFGIMYHDLVRVVREQLPASVDSIVGRVTDLQTSAAGQTVSLDDGSRIDCDLVIIATGMNDALRQKLGIKRKVVFEKQSLSFGFSIRSTAEAGFQTRALTYYGESLSDQIDYLSLFPIGDIMRANLFTFLDHRDPWIRDLRQRPKETLLAAMPALEGLLGDFEVVDRVQNWVMDLSVVENHRQDGVVLIGDSFQTSCPAAGTGVSRLLADVEALCTVHVPRWFETPNITAAKIGQFYDDPSKRASDERAARLAEYRRSLTIDGSLRWSLHRRQLYLRRQVLNWIDGFDPGWTKRLKQRMTATDQAA